MPQPQSSATTLVLFEDSAASQLAPLNLLRPSYELIIGATSLREKIERHFGLRATKFFLRKYLRDSSDAAFAPDKIHGDVFLVNARLVCDAAIANSILTLPRNSLLMRDNTLIAGHIDAKESDQFVLSDKGFAMWLSQSLFKTKPSTATLIDHPWDIIRYFDQGLLDDLAAISKSATPIEKNIPGVHLLNASQIFSGSNTRIFPGVLINAEKGPVIIGSSTTILPHVYLEGPCFIGDDVIVKPFTSISHASIGRACRVAGEIHTTTLHAFVNKQHEGFIGHSYFAPWVNIGAGTITSNLKNTYGPVRVMRDGVQVDTGLQFLGTIAGDHTKFGINTMLNTGTIAGVGCNVVGAGFPKKEIPSFQWGPTGVRYDFEKFIALAKTVMQRRGQALTPHEVAVLRTVYGDAGEPRHES